MNYAELKKITEQLKEDGNDINIFSVIFYLLKNKKCDNRSHRTEKRKLRLLSHKLNLILHKNPTHLKFALLPR